MKAARGSRGFTLIELMIVIAIIAILSAILIPNHTRSRGRANLTACGQNTKTIATAVNMYTNENEGLYPRQTILGNGSQWNGSGAPFLVPKFLATYPVCPAVTGAGGSAMAYQLVVGKTGAGQMYSYVGCFSGGHTSVGTPQGYPMFATGTWFSWGEGLREKP